MAEKTAESHEFHQMNYYARLGIEPNATIDEIKKAFKDLSFKHHPDRGGVLFAQQYLSEAYTTLVDTELRKKYDLSVSVGVPNIRQRDDFVRRTREATAPYHQENTKNTLTPEAVKEKALQEVSKGGYSYRLYINRMVKEGYSGAAFLIQDPDVQSEIINNAIKEAQLGPYAYGKFVKLWYFEGFDRQILYKSSGLVRAINQGCLNEIIKGPDFYEHHAQSWFHNAQIDVSSILKSSEALAIIKAELCANAQKGAKFFIRVLARWATHGFDEKNIYKDPIFIKIIKEELIAHKGNGQYLYDSYIESWSRFGIDIRELS